MELFGVRRPRGRDLATGIVLGAALGIAALFLYLGTTESNTTGATITILFGSMFVISRLDGSGVRGARRVLARHRRRALPAAALEHAQPRHSLRPRRPVRTVGVWYLLAMALAVSLSCVTIGAILSTAVLIGPLRPRFG